MSDVLGSWAEMLAAHKAFNEQDAQFADEVDARWQVTIVGGTLGSTLSVCPVCAACVPNTNTAKVLHQAWHKQPALTFDDLPTPSERMEG